MPYYSRDPKRDHHFDNHPYLSIRGPLYYLTEQVAGCEPDDAFLAVFILVGRSFWVYFALEFAFGGFRVWGHNRVKLIAALWTWGRNPKTLITSSDGSNPKP